MEWLIGAITVLFSTAFWLEMRGIQTFESRTGRIPPRSRTFPYMQDFWTNGWFGDLLAFSLIDFAVIPAATHHGFAWWMMATAISGILITVLFYSYATSSNRKREDWGYIMRGTEWIPTMGGKIHLVYFFLQASVASLGLILTATLALNSWQLIVGYTGAGLYLLAFMGDIRRGLLTP